MTAVLRWVIDWEGAALQWVLHMLTSGVGPFWARLMYRMKRSMSCCCVTVKMHEKPSAGCMALKSCANLHQQSRCYHLHHKR